MNSISNDKINYETKAVCSHMNRPRSSGTKHLTQPPERKCFLDNNTACLWKQYRYITISAMDLKPFLKLLLLLLVVHVYVFLCGLAYYMFERHSKLAVSNVEQVLDKHFYNAALLRPHLRPKSPSKTTVVRELRIAVKKDQQMEIKVAFGSLWKSYLFSLTTVASLG